MGEIVALNPDAEGLTVVWADGGASRYPWLWLRDHGHDEETLHPVTQQRQLFTARLPRDLRGTEASLAGEAVEIVWSDGGRASRLPLAFLARYRQPQPPSARVEVAPVLWDAASIGTALPTAPYDAVMESEAGLRQWLEGVAAYGFAIATGTPATTEATEALIRRVGYIRETIFGGFWSFTADLSKADTAYTTLELRPHTDGTYAHDAPGLQLLHCLEFEGSGGESIQVDGFRIAEELRQTAPAHYETLSRVAVPGQYIGDGVHLMAARPVFRHDHSGRLVQVSFNNYDRAPFLLPEAEMRAFYAAIRAFDELANDRRLQWRHRLAPGEAMLFDNWRVLHGRAAYDGKRTLCGAYLNHEDFESRLRLLQAR